jgi:hypothetical protein
MIPRDLIDPLTDDEVHESLVERSVLFFKELSSRLREEASRKWRVTSLNLDIGLLRRRRRNWILALGQETFGQLQGGELSPEALREYVEEIRSLEGQIAAAEMRVDDLGEDELLEAGERHALVEPMPRRRRSKRVPRRRMAAAEAETGEEPEEEEVNLDSPPGIG